MLTQIRIRDFAIIEELELELSTGLTVVTGETGAGKSIMIDAIGLVLGDRAETGSIRHGAAKAEISLMLETDRQTILDWLQTHDIEAEEQCLLRRVITSEGRSRAYINGSAVTLSMLRELGEQLVEISGQNTHQSLVKAARQRTLLDNHAGLGTQLQELGSVWEELHQLSLQLDQLTASRSEHQARLDLLTFQLQELQALELQSNELNSLYEEQKRLAHADQLLQNASEAVLLLYENDPSIYQQLSTLAASLSDSSRFDQRFTESSELIESAAIKIQEAVENLRFLQSEFDCDPARLGEVDDRLSKIHGLARKHQVEPGKLFEKWQQLESELAELTAPEQTPEALQKQLDEKITVYDTLAKKITRKRRQSAKKMSELITSAMQGLGMEGGEFEIGLMPLAENERRKSGLETIEFQVSANPGLPAKPLAKVASGGELSRISLAIQLIAAAQSDLPTLIFDEVDVGIGGAVAETVGKQLRELGNHCQVFCVTHLPQVAALGHQHLQVVKNKQKESTNTQLDTLSKQARIEEIARMLGGQKITAQTLAHAEEMLG